MNQSPRDALLTIKEAQQLLRIGRTKCWELIGEGRLDVVRLGNRCTRVKESSVYRLINGEGCV